MTMTTGGMTRLGIDRLGRRYDQEWRILLLKFLGSWMTPDVLNFRNPFELKNKAMIFCSSCSNLFSATCAWIIRATSALHGSGALRLLWLFDHPRHF